MVVVTNLPIARAVTFTFGERPLGFTLEEVRLGNGRISCRVSHVEKPDLHEILKWHVIKIETQDVSTIPLSEMNAELNRYSGSIRITFGMLVEKAEGPITARHVTHQQQQHQHQHQSPRKPGSDSGPSTARPGNSPLKIAVSEEQRRLDIAACWQVETCAAIDELGDEADLEYTKILKRVQASGQG
jgi:hypothetical protein